MTTLNQLRSFLGSFEKQASDGIKGVNSSHPTASAPTGDQTPKEGPRGSEHSKDLKDVPGPDNVETVAEAKPDEANGQQMNVGLQAKAVGTDPANEKDYGHGHPDPGTSHPAKTDKEAFLKSVAETEKLANGFLAKIAAGRGNKDATKTETTTVSDAQKAAAAGYVEATTAIDAGAANEDLTKVAEVIVGRAVLAARLVAQQLKKAEAEEETEEAPAKKDEGGSEGSEPASAAPAEDTSGLISQMSGEGGGAPGAEGGDAGSELLSVLAEMGIPPEALIQQLQSMGGAGGAGAPPADPMAAMGGGGAPPAADPMAGGDPMAGAVPPPMDPTKMAKVAGLLLLTKQVKSAVAAGKLHVTGVKDAKHAERRASIKKAIRDLINPRG